MNGLRKIIPEALGSVSLATINRCYHHGMRIIDAYRGGFAYGTKSFRETVYKGHRHVDKSKWLFLIS